jgi:hypothetical protein
MRCPPRLWHQHWLAVHSIRHTSVIGHLRIMCFSIAALDRKSRDGKGLDARRRRGVEKTAEVAISGGAVVDLAA